MKKVIVQPFEGPVGLVIGSSSALLKIQRNR